MQTERIAPADRADDAGTPRAPRKASRLLGALEAENAQLRHTVADLALQTAILRERLQQA
jgi:hypothetical protein